MWCWPSRILTQASPLNCNCKFCMGCTVVAEDVGLPVLGDTGNGRVGVVAPSAAEFGAACMVIMGFGPDKFGIADFGMLAIDVVVFGVAVFDSALVVAVLAFTLGSALTFKGAVIGGGTEMLSGREFVALTAFGWGTGVASRAGPPVAGIGFGPVAGMASLCDSQR